jgi:hypothetical protein
MTFKSFLTVLLLAWPGVTRGATLTNLVLTFNHSGPSPTTYTTSLTVTSNHVARVLHLNIFPISSAANPRLVVDVGTTNNVATYTTGDFSAFGGAPVVVGPATLRLTATAAANTTVSGTLFCSAEITSLEDTFVPSNTVVIPADIGGPVNIIMESSIDLVSWTAAMPGVYGTNTLKRFFRIRAERTP